LALLGQRNRYSHVPLDTDAVTKQSIPAGSLVILPLPLPPAATTSVAQFAESHGSNAGAARSPPDPTGASAAAIEMAATIAPAFI
jgi:hypothetical protein